MAERDHAAFTARLPSDAQFFSGAQLLRGKAAVAAGWTRCFDGMQAPSSWAPDRVEVLPDRSPAWPTGHVRNPAGAPVACFNSVWRQEAPGRWRVVFDKGGPLTPAEQHGAKPP